MKHLFIITYLFAFTLCEAQTIKPVLKTVLAEKLKESSGLVFTRDGLWTFNDGKSASIYKIDTATGNILQEVIIANTSFIDAEGITKDDQYLYIEDAGNNSGSRRDLKIVRIKLDNISNTLPQQTVNADVIYFYYPDQTLFNGAKKDNNFDCESIIATTDSLYLFTKRRGDNTSGLYSLPKTPGNFKANPLGTFNTNGLITDAALSPDGKYLLLIGYLKGHYSSFIWVFSNFKNHNFFSGKAQRLLLNEKNDTWQTEAIAFLDKSSLWISCEMTQDHPAALYKLNAIK